MFRFLDVMVKENRKTGSEGFVPTVINAAKFPETPTGSLVKSEVSQYYT